MGNCDLCGTTIGPNAKRYSPSQMKTAVRAGLRPSSDFLDLAAALGRPLKEATAGWIQRIMVDTTDWALCPSCARQVERYLRRS